MRRKITLAFLILAAFLLQTTVFQYFQIASVTPNLLLILTSAFGLMRGSLFGFYALLYMYIGYLNGFFCKVFYDDDIKVHIVLVAASDLVYSLLMYVLQFLLRVRLHFFDYLAHIILPEMVYTVVLSILLYRLLFIINRKLTENEMEGQQSPWQRR